MFAGAASKQQIKCLKCNVFISICGLTSCRHTKKTHKLPVMTHVLCMVGCPVCFLRLVDTHYPLIKGCLCVCVCSCVYKRFLIVSSTNTWSTSLWLWHWHRASCCLFLAFKYFLERQRKLNYTQSVAKCLMSRVIHSNTLQPPWHLFRKRIWKLCCCHSPTHALGGEALNGTDVMTIAA